MNKNLYRIIFNIKRGLRMAVAETAMGLGKGGSGETAGGFAGCLISVLRPLNLAIVAALGGLLSIASVQAQIVADPSAPVSQRPTVVQTASSLPQVNIQTPSAAGVSRNTYSQFDVTSQGAILNNSRTDVQTQLGGWVQANPWLAGGSARVILNEVNTSSPSQLRGYVEVAGQRAEVIIANPAGIAVNGGGFLNASSVTLTTGTPVMNGGSLESYRVQRGSVSIDGTGLDTRTADYTNILARAVQVNAGLWAKDLKLVIGTNDIAASNAAAPTVNGAAIATGVAPAYALDVALLGGMYAGKILLVGTEAGLGVRNAGIVGATAGDVVLQNNGWLSNSGSVKASGNIQITTAGDLSNSGTLYASGDTQISSQSSINNQAAGLIAAQGNTSVQADGQISSVAGSVMAAGLNPDGSIGTTGNLTVNASQAAALNGETRAGGDAQVSATQLNLASGTFTAQNITLSATTGDINASAATVSAQSRLQASAVTYLITDGANVSATQLQLAAHDLSNIGGEILQTGTADLDMTLAGNLNNTRGRIASNSQNLTLTAHTLTNTDGKIEHAGGGALTLNTVELDNTAALIRSAQNISLTAANVVNSNTQGTDQGIEGNNVSISAATISNDTGAVRADNNITITSSGHLNNRTGLISATNTLVVQDLGASKSLVLSNTAGQLIAGQNANVNAASLTGDGQVLSKADLSIALTTDFNNTSSGEVSATGNASISSTANITNSGTLQAGSTLDIAARAITNTASLVGGSVKLQASQRVLNLGPQAFIGASDRSGLLQILAPEIVNRDDVTTTDTAATTSIVGLGTVVFAGGVDGTGNYTAANAVRNESAYISSVADMRIVANTLTNTRRVLQTSDTYVPTGQTVQGQVVWSASTPDVPRGRYIEPPHGGSMNSDYLYTAYEGTLARNSITQISPKAVIEAAGNLNPVVTQLQNYWSAVTAAGNIALNGVTLDQDGWQNGNSINPGTAITPYGESASYSGTYVYQTYRGSIWTNSWGPTSPVVTPLAGYGASWTAGGTISGSGNTVNNTSGINPNTPLGSQSGSPQNTPVTSGHPLPNFSLPSGGLFHTNPNPASRYLIETNPAFTSKQQWISSDYFFAQLGMDPTKTQKRLGDGYYEQQLIKEQLIGLTGRAILDYPDAQSQYQALMQAGAAYAKQLNLAPGVALSEAQIAQLSGDVVIMQETQVNGETVLVPVVYLGAHSSASLLPTGSLISANNIALANSQNITNSGTIRAQQTLSLDAQDINNQGGKLQSGGLMQLTSQNDINLTSATVKAGSLNLDAGKNIVLSTDARQVTSTVQGGTRVSTQLGQAASIDVADNALIKTGGDLVQNAGAIAIGGDLQTNIGGNWTLGAVQSSEITRAETATGHSNTDVIQQHTSSLSVGGASNLSVANDFTAQGAALTLQGPVTLQTGGNLTLSAVKDSIKVDSTSASSRHKESTQSFNEAVRGSTLQAGDNLNLISGKDITVSGTTLNATQGQATLLATGNVNLLTETERHQSDNQHEGSHSSLIGSRSSADHITSSRVDNVVSDLSANTILISAGQDINLQGANANAAQDASLFAQRDVNLTAAQNTTSQSQFHQESSSGLTGSLAAGISYTKAQASQNATLQDTTSVGASVGGTNVLISAGRDATIQAAQVLADQNIDITAGRDVQLLQATDSQTTSNASQSSSTGLQLLVGLAPKQTAFSKTSADGLGQGTSTTAVTSVLSANNGKLTITAGTDSQYQGVGQGNITTQGADLLAKGDVTLSANRVDLGAAQGDSTSMSQSSTRSLSVGAALAGTVGSKITQIYEQAQAAKDGTGNARLDAALALKSGYDSYKLIDGGAKAAMATADAGKAKGGDSAFGISASINSSHSDSKSADNSSTQRGSNLQADNINITARETDINTQGAKLQAQNISLDAKRDINLVAASNAAATQSSNSNASAGVGVTFGLGQQNGISFQIGGSTGRGNANGTETTFDNTLVTASNQLSLKSGADTKLQGAQLAGKQVTADIGGDLFIATLQDSSNYTSKQESSGFGISLCIPPICVGLSSFSVNAAQQNIDHNYQSAVGQSGINAGVDGFDIQVKGNTDLKGAAITSSAEQSKNKLSTASLTYSDLENKQDTSASSYSLSVGNSTSALAQVGVNLMANLAGQVGLPENASEHSSTQSVISPTTVTITGTGDTEKDTQSQTNAETLTSRDASSANQSLKNTLTLQDAAKLQQDLKTAQQNQQAAQLVGSVMDNMIGDVAATKGWKEGSTEKVLLHGLSGAIQASIAGGSLAAGAAAGAVNEKLIPLMIDYLEKNGVPQYIKDEKGNTIKNPQFADLMKIGSTLLGAGVGAAVGGGASNVALGASVGLTGTTENYLKHAEILRKKKLEDDIAACGSKADCAAPLQAELNKINVLDKERDAELAAACDGSNPSRCSLEQQKVRNVAAEVILKGDKDVLLGADGKHTLSQAVGTFDKGKLLIQTAQGTIVSVLDGYITAVSTLVEIVQSPVESAKKFGAQAQVAAQDAKEALEWIANNPIKYKEIAQAAENQLRSDLATAMQNGDEAAVGAMVGGVLANFSPDPLKKINALNKVIDEVKLAKKAEALAARTDIDKAVVISAGSKGNWSPQANGNLEAKTAYILDNGHSYITDPAGRVKGVEADLTGIASDRNKYQQGCVGKCGNVGDDGGHLIASALGGAGDRINIVPQDATLNRGAWRNMEAFLKKEIDAGKSVSIKIDVGYPAGSGVRPDSFNVIATIAGKPVSFRFTQ